MKFLIFFLVSATAVNGFVPTLVNRIVGGTSANITDYPYQVSLRYNDEHICGGTILDTTTILTAAHCVYSIDTSILSIRVGSTNHQKGEQYQIREIIQHEKYDTETFDNDLAILKLSQPLTFSDSIQPIPLQSEEVPTGTTAWVSGWGVLQEGNIDIPTGLRAVDVKVISNEECDSKYRTAYISSNMLCAQTPNKDSCQGDSGGPLVAEGRLIGIVSWGWGCARPKYPGVYAKVSKMYQWIQQYS